MEGGRCTLKVKSAHWHTNSRFSLRETKTSPEEASLTRKIGLMGSALEFWWDPSYPFLSKSSDPTDVLLFMNSAPWKLHWNSLLQLFEWWIFSLFEVAKVRLLYRADSNWIFVINSFNQPSRYLYYLKHDSWNNVRLKLLNLLVFQISTWLPILFQFHFSVSQLLSGSAYCCSFAQHQISLSEINDASW